MSVLVETSIGAFTVDLYTDGEQLGALLGLAVPCPDLHLRSPEVPNASRNFLKLCAIKYYNGVLFYNVQADFVVQTGDPTGTGRGGTSVYGLLYGDQAQYFDAEHLPSL